MLERQTKSRENEDLFKLTLSPMASTADRQTEKRRSSSESHLVLDGMPGRAQ